MALSMFTNIKENCKFINDFGLHSIKSLTAMSIGKLQVIAFDTAVQTIK